MPEITHPRCGRCLLRPPCCLCASVPHVEGRTGVLVLRHVIESYRRSNSARIAALALPRCEVASYGAPGEAFDERRLEGEGTWLLYPGGAPLDTRAEKPRRLVVLDGSWRQARRMLIRLPALHRMPRLSLPAPSDPPLRLRQGRAAHEMATLEAIARALWLLEGEAIGRPLLSLYSLFVERALLDTNGGRARARAGLPS